ncbi:hypothetical protein KHQ88_00030 [Mycoplasmatota bacterium]|nr:hypothetical protein KHQ88_00030 [Mycoplasmatota bacterium]
MIKTLLVCDDSTGANASGILLKNLKLRTLSIIHHKNAKFPSDYDAISVSTDSRGVDSETAYKRVDFVLNKFKNNKIDIINKRVDSTLRGNIGSELNAFYNMFPNKKIAIVPSYPNSNRVCVNGLVYVSGVPLENSDVAKDPKMPIFSSNAKTLFDKQFLGSIDNVYTHEYHCLDDLKETIINKYKENDALIFDAETNEHVEIIAKALIEANIDVITVDPGYFTYVYTKQYILNKTNTIHRYVYLVGSVTDTTYMQLNHIKANEEFMIVPIDANQLLNDENIHSIIQDIVSEIKKSHQRHIVITTTDPKSRIILNLQNIALNLKTDVDQVSKIINQNLSKILNAILDEIDGVSGVFGSGGDTALSFLEFNDAYGIELFNEVIPLCVYGKVVGGKYDGLPIITKGGMIGDQNAYILVKKFFEEELNYD